jgi:hypothetical protein
MKTFDRADPPPPMLAWSSWDFYPSPWNGGTLIAHCADNPRAPFTGFAAPGASLCGESGFDTARWRRAEWPSMENFLCHEHPLRMETVDLDSVRADVPDDFAPWVARSTAAHIERLRSFALHRPEEPEADVLADLLHLEMEEAFPGTLESLYADYTLPVTPMEQPRVQLRALLLERFPYLSMSRRKALDLLGQAVGFVLLYLAYRMVREPWAPEGTHVDVLRLYEVSIGEFTLWLYGLGHVLLPVLFLTWAYFRRPQSFPLVRNTMVLTIILPVAAYLAYAPGKVYANEIAASVPTNALPTMPALHLAMAISLAFFGIRLCRRNISALAWAAYPVLVALVLIISGSRYPIPTIAFATMTLVVAYFLAERMVPRLWLPLDLFGRWRQTHAQND